MGFSSAPCQYFAIVYARLCLIMVTTAVIVPRIKSILFSDVVNISIELSQSSESRHEKLRVRPGRRANHDFKSLFVDNNHLLQLLFLKSSRHLLYSSALRQHGSKCPLLIFLELADDVTLYSLSFYFCGDRKPYGLWHSRRNEVYLTPDGPYGRDPTFPPGYLWRHRKCPEIQVLAQTPSATGSHFTGGFLHSVKVGVFLNYSQSFGDLNEKHGHKKCDLITKSAFLFPVKIFQETET
ncbi:hypothetical protein RRG08_014103 [Elysia crispata]|uniref:Uncharacterized protein n=1 Tax=Elysia crispata TaxID=231223 RepID=A0AAE0XQL2_9GAST|nr:hypothetical protein RRG08_014103 [Elysia crispata]